MADPILHIKDSFYFEVPKILWPSTFRKRADFPEVWISLDPQFQDWQFHRLYQHLEALHAGLPSETEAHRDWHSWVHGNHANFAKPFGEFLESRYAEYITRFRAWQAEKIVAANSAKDQPALKAAEALRLHDYLDLPEVADQTYAKFAGLRATREFQIEYAKAKELSRPIKGHGGYNEDESAGPWSHDKIEAYNWHLSGKILIPQPFGRLRNLHEPESTIIDQQTGWINHDHFGFCISKFMVIEVAVGIVIWLVFSWLAQRMAKGTPPRGKVWNLLEVFVVFIHDQIAKPSLGGNHNDEHHGTEAHGRAAGEPEHMAHGHAALKHAHEPSPATRYTPLLCTIFFFILGCNLAGIVPWIGSPTGTWGVTLALALVTLLAGFIGGVRQFGLVGYFLNQIPGMDLTWYLALFLKPAIFLIEILGLLVKHAVLSVRLVANIFAGHMVLLSILGLAFGAAAAHQFSTPQGVSSLWWVAAIPAIVGCTLLNILELFVAFLQAFVFTLLSALFIGAAIHKH